MTRNDIAKPPEQTLISGNGATWKRFGKEDAEHGKAHR